MKALVLMAVLALPIAARADEQAECEKTCDEVAKMCVDACAKKAKGGADACKPQCTKVGEGCKKDCKEPAK